MTLPVTAMPYTWKMGALPRLRRSRSSDNTTLPNRSMERDSPGRVFCVLVLGCSIPYQVSANSICFNQRVRLHSSFGVSNYRSKKPG